MRLRFGCGTRLWKHNADSRPRFNNAWINNTWIITWFQDLAKVSSQSETAYGRNEPPSLAPSFVLLIKATWFLSGALDFFEDHHRLWGAAACNNFVSVFLLYCCCCCCCCRCFIFPPSLIFFVFFCFWQRRSFFFRAFQFCCCVFLLLLSLVVSKVCGF